jgi:bile acid:Na+ symporter, BASS family
MKLPQESENGRRRLQGRIEEALLELNRLVERRMYLVVLFGIGAGWFLPGLDRAVWLVPYLFAYMTFATALSISARDIGGVARAPGVVLLMIAALHLLMPGVAWLIGALSFGSHSATAVGMVLATLIPVGVLSVVWTSVAYGAVPLALTIVALDSLLSPLILPVTAWLFLGSQVDFDARSLMIGLVWMIVIPTSAGVWLHDLSAGRIGRRMAPLNGPLSKASALAIIAINISAIREILASTQISIVPILAVLPLQVATGFFVGFAMGRILKLPEPEVRTLTFCIGLRNVSAGIVIALRYFSPLTAIPVVLVIVFQQPLAALFQHWFLSHPSVPPVTQEPIAIHQATDRG